MHILSFGIHPCIRHTYVNIMHSYTFFVNSQAVVVCRFSDVIFVNNAHHVELCKQTL